MQWQGLPPVPVWLSWFGRPYRELVAPHLADVSCASERSSTHARGLRRLIGRRLEDPVQAQIEKRDDGVFVRLGVDPRPNGELGGWPLPSELTYRHRAPVTHAGGAVSSNPAERGDEAQVIPPLG